MRSQRKIAHGLPKALYLAHLTLIAPAIAVTAAPSAFAGTVNSDEALAAALKKFDDGRKAFEAGQFEEALIDFKSSLELLPSPNTRLYIGRCYRALGKTASAFLALKLAAREAQDRLGASGEKRYAATRDAANREAADLEARVPRLTLAVPANPPQGLVVRLSGKDVPPAAWGVAAETDPGDVVIEATGPRLVPFKRTITLKEGAQERVELSLTRMPTATLAVRLKSLPAGLTLSLDGQPLDVASAEAPRELDIGQHQLVVGAPGYIPFKWTHSLADAESRTVEVSLAPIKMGGGGPSGTPRWLFFSTAGAAVVAAGVATGIALHAQNQQNQQLRLDPYARDPNVKNSIQSQAVWTDILYSASGVLGAGAVVLAFTTRWRSEEAGATAVSIAPWAGAGCAGFGAHGRF